MACRCNEVLSAPGMAIQKPAVPDPANSMNVGAVPVPATVLIDDSPVVAVGSIPNPPPSALRCNQSPVPYDPCGCSRCGGFSANCSCCAPSICPPAINLVAPEPQNHCALPIENLDSVFYLTNLGIFTIPNCNKEADFYTRSAKKLYPGAILSKSPSGLLLHVLRVGDESVRVVNKCEGCNTLRPGETVPANTPWGVTAPVCSAFSSDVEDCATFLAADFTTPAVGQTAPMRVAGRLTGFITGVKIRVADKFFILQSTSGLVWTLQNVGEGGEVGDTTYWDTDNDGVSDVCIELADVGSPCETEKTSGKIVVCGSDGTQGVIKGRKKGDILSWNPTVNGYSNFQLPGSLITCTPMHGCFTIDPTFDPNVATYLVEVEDSSIFNSPEFASFVPLAIRIDGDKFVLASIVDGTHIRVKPAFDFTVAKVYGDCSINEEILVCVGDCCDQVTGCVPQIVVSPQIIGVRAGVGDPAGRFANEELAVFQHENDTLCEQLVEVVMNLRAGYIQGAGYYHGYSLKRAVGGNEFVPLLSFITQATIVATGSGTEYPQNDLGVGVNNIHSGTMVDALLLPPGAIVSWQLLHKFVSPDSIADPPAYTYSEKWSGYIKTWRHNA